MLIKTKEENSKLDYSKQVRSMNSVRDLTPADKAYLKGHQLSPEKFDRMSPVQQAEWKNECRENHYIKSYDKNFAKGRKVFYMGGK